MKLAALVAGLLSGALGVVSTLLLIRGTAKVPWGIQSYGGRSEPEKKFQVSTRRYLICGLITLAGAFLLSAISTLASYLS